MLETLGFDSSMLVMIIPFCIFAFIFLIGVLISGVLKKKNKVQLGDALNISEFEESMIEMEQAANNSANSNQKKSWSERKTAELEQSHTGISFTVYILIMFASMIALFFLGYMIFKSMIFGLIVAALGYFIPNIFVKKKQEKNQAIFNANLVKALRRMASNLRAGGTLKQAIMDVGKSNSMPIATRTEFINVLSDMEYGASVETAFYKLYDRTGAEDVRTLAVTIEIQRRTGGNLAEAFDNLAKVINKRELQEADIKATLAQAKSSAKLVSFMPFGLTFLLQIIQPNYFDAFYAWGDGLGKIIAFIIYGIICFGIVLIDKMSSIKS